MHGLAVNSSNDVATNEPGLIRRRPRRLDVSKGDTAIAINCLEAVNAEIRTRCDRNSDREVRTNLLDDCGKPGCADKENKQSEKHPGHAAHATTTLFDLSFGRNGHRTADTVRERIRRAATGEGSLR